MVHSAIVSIRMTSLTSIFVCPVSFFASLVGRRYFLAGSVHHFHTLSYCFQFYNHCNLLFFCPVSIFVFSVTFIRILSYNMTSCLYLLFSQLLLICPAAGLPASVTTVVWSLPVPFPSIPPVKVLVPGIH